MKKIILNLRSQPEHVRRNILHVLTVFFAVALLLIWVFSLGTNLSSPETQAKINNDLEPFSALTANIVDGYYSITGSN
ncbi:MAG: hypothetical protein UR90_C0003G0020 [Parcubacteria group bacterium GW2011_GWC1_35_8]|uniref:Uncharacterized protein n=2 Tax=Candidatus Nomuraibacteriota TaxID=1752729 RepID=A0A1F6YUH6_9BACT|nr:MAG: hypothetical protein UR90_C0003G0020 [Parcubacteria group bacterium GW2011_GWC1_35_8]KKP88011.1 MAG: hypothetical protein UR91_C0029G0007 [Candidatus Nomurabacteria bacterium GW2011_GWC2_35_8]OGJ09950.1 MAG: hypothetical protein A2456_01665 [Candidatus Nomurabacteria bacterium RIFOXYC2_FULL_36_19]OGJ15196.1 MAG: hypothetical protein A2554_03185 [Candidatus Nomurabacteria bacterium RIFOXYD2_FULL_35_12]